MTSYSKYENLNRKLDTILKAHELLLNMISKLEDKVMQCPSQCTCCPKAEDSEVKATPFSTPRAPQAKPKPQARPKQTMKKPIARRKQPAVSQKVKPKVQVAKKPGRANKSFVSQKGKVQLPAVKKLGGTKKPVVSSKVGTKKPVVSRKVGTKKPVVSSKVGTKKPVVSNKVKPSPKGKKPSTTKKAVVSTTKLGKTVKPKTDQPRTKKKVIKKAPNISSKSNSVQRTSIPASTSFRSALSSKWTSVKRPLNNKGHSKISSSLEKPTATPARGARSGSDALKRRSADVGFDFYSMPEDPGQRKRGPRGGIGLPKRRRF